MLGFIIVHLRGCTQDGRAAAGAAGSDLKPLRARKAHHLLTPNCAVKMLRICATRRL